MMMGVNSTLDDEFPEGRTAFLVIHGIGEQNPFEALDSSTRGFVRYMQSRQVPFITTHKVADPVGAGGSHWINFYDDKDPISGQLDFYSVEENAKLDLRMK